MKKSYCGEGKFKAILEARMEMNIKNIYAHRRQIDEKLRRRTVLCNILFIS
jgi:hypothetical protein